MRSIRRGAWETNSSSTHAICIKNIGWRECKNINTSKIKTLHFGFGEFGWEWSKISTPEEKANYLWTAIYFLSEQDVIHTDVASWKKYITNTLEEINVEATFEDALKDELWKYGYVDHVYELFDLIYKLSKNPTLLLSFLFKEDSYIYTGNDNEENDMWEAIVDKLGEDENYYVYMKGN